MISLWTLFLSITFGFNSEQIQKAFYSTVLIQHSGNSHCSGVLISHDTVLTAAHCVEEKGFFKNVSVTLHILKNSSFIQDHVRQINLHPQHHFNNIETDLAILKLQNPIPQKLNEARIHFDLKSTYDSYKPEVLLMGYGITPQAYVNPKANKKQILRPQIRGKLLNLKTANNLNYELVLENQLSQACSGDSGGPLMGITKSGAIRLIGIATRAFANPLRFKWDQLLMNTGLASISRPQVCTGKIAFLNIGNFQDWIQKAIQ